MHQGEEKAEAKIVENDSGFRPEGREGVAEMVKRAGIFWGGSCGYL